jgi:hypothetical protein
LGVFGVEIGADEHGGGLRYDGVAVTAQAHHAGGYPMSQRDNAGSNPPVFSIAEPPDFVLIPVA